MISMFCILFITSSVNTFAENVDNPFTISTNRHEALLDTCFANRFNAAKEIILLYPKIEEDTPFGANDFSYLIPHHCLDKVYDYLIAIDAPIKKITIPFDDWYEYSRWYLKTPLISNEWGMLKYLAKLHIIDYSSLVISPITIVHSGFSPVKIDIQLQFMDLYQDYKWPINVTYGYNIHRTLTGKIKKAEVASQCIEKANEMLYEQIPHYSFNDSYPYLRRADYANWSEEDFKENARSNGLERFEGIYQIASDRQRFYVKKYNNQYFVVACGDIQEYMEGDIKGVLLPTAASNVFTGDWNPHDKYNYFSAATFQFNQEVILNISAQNMETPLNLIKVWPTAEEEQQMYEKQWQGSGWALNNGYIVTNNHVAENAKTIIIHSGSKQYTAEVVALDKAHDLAILYCEELKNVKVPYSFRTNLCSVGDDCFVMGYPKADYLGDEIKVTNGIISSRSGYKGNMVSYQISAPTTHGSSGSPMFDENGNVAGIINAGVDELDNVVYAIKISYLRTLLENYDLDKYIPTDGKVNRAAKLSQKVELIKPYIYKLECSTK